MRFHVFLFFVRFVFSYVSCVFVFHVCHMFNVFHVAFMFFTRLSYCAISFMFIFAFVHLDWPAKKTLPEMQVLKGESQTCGCLFLQANPSGKLVVHMHL